MSVNLIRTLRHLKTRQFLRCIATTTVAIMSVLWSAHSHAQLAPQTASQTYILFDPGNRFAVNEPIQFVQGNNPVEFQFYNVFSWVGNHEVYTEVRADSPGLLSIWIDGAPYTVFRFPGLPNIGYVVAVKDTRSHVWQSIHRFSSDTGTPGARVTYRAPPGGGCCKVGLSIKLTFIKLNVDGSRPVVSTLPSGVLHSISPVSMRIMRKDKTPFISYPEIVTLQFRMNTRNATCTQTKATTQNIRLPNVPLSAFPTIGSTYEGNQDVRFDFKCGAGVSVYATLTDAKNPSNRGDTLTTTGSAKGVGVQLLQTSRARTYSNCSPRTPCKFGPDSPEKGNTNQWLIRPRDAFDSEVRFRARYIRTGPIQPGSVEARSTITFSYQ